MRMLIGRPMTSFSVYPKIRVAPVFQLVIIPSRVLEMIASSDDSTIAASIDRVASNRGESLVSLIAFATKMLLPFAIVVQDDMGMPGDWRNIPLHAISKGAHFCGKL